MTTRAILTGHSRGLGAALCEALLGRGVAVLALARSTPPGLTGRFPGRLREVALDLSDSAALVAWLEGGTLRDFLADAGQALLVDNAGLLEPVALAGHQDPAAIVRAVALNVAAPLLLANAFAAATAGCADRRILHVSSGAARTPYAGWNVYCATKAALDHHARAVAAENLPGLRIVSLAPGVVDTGMQALIRDADPEDFPMRDRFVAMQAAGGLARPEDAARRMVDFLLGDGYGAAPTADIRELAGS